MNSHRLLGNLTVAVLASTVVCEASATAQLGGVVSTSFSAGQGLCNKSSSVPLTTLQDTFALNLAATCLADGSTATGNLRAEAAAGSIGLRISAAGESSVAAEVSYIDNWLLKAAPGTLPGTYTVPVSFKVEGTVSPGAVARLNRFLDFSLSERDFYAGIGPKTLISVTGSVSATGAFSQTFAGTVDFRYFGPGSALPMTADVELLMFAPQLEKGTIDFYNTASVSMTLLPGWSATTSSGSPVIFAPVPEPTTGLMWAAGVGLLGTLRSRRRASLAVRH